MRKSNNLSAVIDLGSSGIRLLIAEKKTTKWKTLETLERKADWDEMFLLLRKYLMNHLMK